MSTRGLGPRRTRSLLAALSAAAVGASGLAAVTAAPASAAPDCAVAYPQDQLTDGQAVTGLTVTKGTEPEPFSGTIEGVLKDGIAPGTDMILAELTSPAVEANGVWAGMSGSPVYIGGELVGAVSYTLNEGKTSLAGITPAAEMLSLRAGQVNQRAQIDPGTRNELAASGTATRSQLASGMRALPAPISISGLSQKRFDQLEGWLDDLGPVTRAGGSTTGLTEESDVSDIVPGGNIAASLGFGYVTASATGTITSVCGDRVVAFGHPFNYAGDATYSMHPASTVAIQPGATFAGFKLANLSAPVGTIDGDRLAGISGTIGAPPQTFPVTSTATYRGRTVSGTTNVSVVDLVADAGLANAFAVSDRALDRAGSGSALATWRIDGKRRNGTAFAVRGSNLYSSDSDVASAPLTELAQQLGSLLENTTEAVTITGITTETTLTDDASTYNVGRTWQKIGTGLKRITNSAPAVLKAGRSIQIRVELYSRTGDTIYRDVPVSATTRSTGRVGRLVLSGGYAGEDEYFFFDSEEEFYDEYEDEIFGGTIGKTIPELVKQLEAAPKNNVVSSTFSVPGTATQKRAITLGTTVSGAAVVPVRVIR